MMNFLKKACREFSEFVDRNTSCCQSVVNNKEPILVSETETKVNLIELLDAYQEESGKTFKPELAADVKEAMKYLGLKLSEEVGEINGPIAKHLYHGKNLDLDNVAEEIGDALWYLANLANVLGFKLSDIATRNIDKLRQRHGEKYRKEHYVQQ